MARNYALDYARAIMLTVGIPYHIACAYQIGGGWLVDAQQPDIAATLFAGVMHSFRMQAFFMLSGFFASMVLSRRDWRTWLKDRAARILLPAVATTVLIGPLLIYITAYAVNGSHDQSMRFLIDSFPVGWDFHTWFLYTLFGYCVAFALTRDRIVPAIDRWMERITQIRITRNAPVMILLMVAFLVLWAFVPSVWSRVAGKNLVTDYFYVSLIYLPFFLTGVVADRSAVVAKAVFRPSPLLVAVGVIALLGYVGTELYDQSRCVGGECGVVAAGVSKVLRAICGMFTAFAFFGLMHRLRPGHNAIISYVVSGSLVMYLFHLPAVLVLVYLFRFVHLPALVEMAILNLIVFAWVVAAFEVVRRSRLLRLLFNGGDVRPEVTLTLGRSRPVAPTE